MIDHNPPTAAAIKTARESANLTQLELAGRLIDATPEEIERFRQLTHTLYALRNWEAGRNTPDKRNTQRLRRTLTLPE